MPLLATTTTRGDLVTSYVANNLRKIFPNYNLVDKNKLLPGNRSVDFVLADKTGKTLFVECKASRLYEKQAGQLFDYYSAILNLEPQPKVSTFVVIAAGIDPLLRKQFAGLDVSFKTYQELDIPFRKLLEDEKRGRSRLTPTMATLVAKWEKNNTRIVDVESVVKQLGCSRTYARTLLHRLETKRWVERVSKGFYLFIPARFGYEERFPPTDPLIIGSKLIEPYYFSYGSATSFYGFSKQVPSIHFIATRKKKPAYLWKSVGFRFVTLSKTKFFGSKPLIIREVEVRMAEPEKAILDALDKPKYAGGMEEVIKVIYRGFRKVDSQKLANYAIRMRSHTLCQRLGFVLDFLDSRRLTKFPHHLRSSLLSRIGKSWVSLSPRGEKKGELVKEWRIVKNIPDRQLLAEIDIA